MLCPVNVIILYYSICDLFTNIPNSAACLSGRQANSEAPACLLASLSAFGEAGRQAGSGTIIKKGDVSPLFHDDK